MNRNASLTDLYCTDFSTNNSDKILYNEPFSFCKPGSPIAFCNKLTAPAPYNIILGQNRAHYGSSYLPDTAFSISIHFDTGINLIKLAPHNNEFFRLSRFSRSGIKEQYNGEMFEAGPKTYGYELGAPDSEHSSGYWKPCRKHIPLANCSGAISHCTIHRKLYV
jgi:hypothetical protein